MALKAAPVLALALQNISKIIFNTVISNVVFMQIQRIHSNYVACEMIYWKADSETEYMKPLAHARLSDTLRTQKQHRRCVGCE